MISFSQRRQQRKLCNNESVLSGHKSHAEECLWPGDYGQGHGRTRVAHLEVFAGVDVLAIHRRKCTADGAAGQDRETVSDYGNESVDGFDGQNAAEQDSVGYGEVAEGAGGSSSNIDVQYSLRLLSVTSMDGKVAGLSGRISGNDSCAA